MSRIAMQMTGAFWAAWRALGQPHLKLIAPLGDWRLPAGYSYLAAEDTVVDAAGRPATDLHELWTAQTVAAVPVKSSDRAFDPTVGGFVATGNVSYDLPADARAAAESAWGVQDAAGRLWRVVRVLAELAGAPVTVELELR